MPRKAALPVVMEVPCPPKRTRKCVDKSFELIMHDNAGGVMKVTLDLGVKLTELRLVDYMKDENLSLLAAQKRKPWYCYTVQYYRAEALDAKGAKLFDIRV